MSSKSRHAAPPPPAPTPGQRLDKWLWAARFFKTRTLAGDEIERGRVLVNAQHAKPSREVRPGDRLSLRQGNSPVAREVQVLGLSEARGPAPQAQQLYAETPESLAAQAEWLARKPYAIDPAVAMEQGRPTKSDRRQLVEWQRWSASLDDDTWAGATARGFGFWFRSASRAA